MARLIVLACDVLTCASTHSVTGMWMTKYARNSQSYGRRESGTTAEELMAAEDGSELGARGEQESS